MFFAFSFKMWYYVYLGDVLIRRTSSLKTASRVGNLNPVNYGFKNLNGAKNSVANAANRVQGFIFGVTPGFGSGYAGIAA